MPLGGWGDTRRLDAKKGLSLRSFQPQFRKRKMHRLPAKRRWVGEGPPGRYQEYDQTKVTEIGKSRMETRQEEKEGKVMKFESGKSTHQHRSSGSTSTSSFKTRGVSGKWDMERDRMDRGGRRNSPKEVTTVTKVAMFIAEGKAHGRCEKGKTY